MAFLIRHRRAVTVAVPLVPSLAMFFLFGGIAGGWGNFLAASALALGLWIGMKVFLDGLTAGDASHDTTER